MKFLKTILLVITLGLLISANTTIFVNAADVTVSIDGIVLSEDSPYWKNGDQVSSSYLDDWNVYYQASENTLILKDAEIYGRVNAQCSVIRVLGDSAIYAEDVSSGECIALSCTDTTITCEGTLTVTSGKSGTSGISAGIYAEVSLAISGGGKITISAENVNGNAYGIYATKNILVNGCDIYSEAKSVKSNGYGIVSRNGKTEIQNSCGSSTGSKRAFLNEPTFLGSEDLTINGSYSAQTMSWSKKSLAPQKEEIVASFTSQTYVFGDPDIGFSLSNAPLSDFQIEYYVSNAWTSSIPRNAGVYSVRISRPEDDRYFAFETVIERGLEIKKQAIAIPNAGEKPYTGQYLKSDLQSNDFYTVTQGDHIAVGDYEVFLTLRDPANYTWENRESESVVVIFKIISAQNQILDVTISDWIYGETPSTPTATAVHGTVRFEYYDVNNILLDSIPQNAGEYKLRAYVSSDNENYETVYSDYVSFCIHKAQVKLPDAGKKIYTGSYLESDLLTNQIYQVYHCGGISAGKYEVILTLQDPENYKWENTNAVSTTIYFEISRAKNEIKNVAIADWIYGEAPSTPTATATYGAVQFEYYDAYGNKLESAPTNAGEYKLRAYVLANGDDYEGAYSEFVVFSIQKAKVEVPDAGKKIYTGEKLTSDLKNTHDYYVQNNGGISVGEYEIILVLKEPANYIWSTGEEQKTSVIFEIIAVANKIDNVSISDWTYGEAPSTPTATATYGIVQFEYYDVNNEPLEGAPHIAGEYKLRAYVLSDGENYETVYSDYFTFQIHKAKVKIPDVGKKIYTGEHLESDLVSTNIYSVYQQGGVSVGTYPVVLTLLDSINYKWESTNTISIIIYFEISRLRNEIKNVSIADWTYGETPSIPTAIVTYGVVQFEYYNVYGEKLETVPKNAGAYKLRACVWESGECCESVYSEFVDFCIQKAEVEVPDVGKKMYTGKKLMSDLKNTHDYVVQNNGGISVGKYEVVLILKEPANYIWSTGEELKTIVVFEIIGVVNEICDVSISDWTYGEAPSTPMATASYGKIQFEYYDVNDKLLDGIPYDAGTYKLRACVLSDSENYETVFSNYVIFRIHKVKVKAPDAGKKIYTGQKLMCDLYDNDIYAVSQRGGVNVGKYEVYLTLRDCKNYEWENSSYDVTIVMFEIISSINKITVVSIPDWIYGDSPSTPIGESMYGITQFEYYTVNNEPLEGAPHIAGEYKLRAYVLSDGENYETVYSDYFTFQIHKAKVKIPDVGKKIYTGEHLESDLVSTIIYSVYQQGGVSVGTYPVVLTLLDPINYSWIDDGEAAITLDFQIVIGNNVISGVTIDNWYYGETQKEPSATAKYGKVLYEFYDAHGVKLDAIPTDAGKYQVRAFVIGDGKNYDTIYSDFTAFEIYKKIVNAPERLETKAYTGELLKSDVFDTDTYRVTKNNGGIHIGQYEVELTLNDPENYRWSTTEDDSISVFFEIVTVTNVVSDVVISDWTYGDEPSTPFAAAKIGEVQFRYYDASGKALTSPPRDAGEYRVKAYVPADRENYIAVESQNFTYFTIYKKAILVPEITEHALYNGMYQECNLPETEYYTVSKAGGVEVGIYHVTLSLKNTKNYYWAIGDETKDKTLYFHITKNNGNSIGSFYVEDSVYGEERKDPHAISVFGDVKFTYSDTYGGNYTPTVPKKAGTWYVKATVTNTKNYNGCFEIRSFTIEKSVVAYPDNAGYKVYNGEKQKSDLTDTEFYIVGVNRGGTNIGDYEVVLHLRDAKNTVWSDGTTEEKGLVFSILSTKNVISNVVIEDFTYGGTFVYPYATALFGDVQFEYYDSNGAILDGFPTKAGVYMVRAYVINGSGEFEYSEDFTTLEIHKAKVPMPMADSSEFVYNGEMHRYFVAESPLYFIINDRRTRVGSQTVTVMLNDKDNYVWENGTGDDIHFIFTVQEGSFTDRIDDATGGEGFRTAEIIFLGICGGAAVIFSSVVFCRKFYKKRFTKRKK